MLRCRCGYLKVVATRLEEMIIEHIDTPPDVSLPKRGTNLWFAFISVATLGTATTHQITEHLNSLDEYSDQTSADVSTQLTILRYKGVVEKIENRKSSTGGSTWYLTTAAKRLVGG